jgi:chromosome partitioning protein
VGAERLLAADALAGLLGLRSALANSSRDLDLILVDTRPDEAHGVLNAYVAATSVWIVTTPVPAAVEVVPRLLGTIERVRAGLNPSLEVEAIIPTCFDARTRVHAGGVAALRGAFGDLVTLPIPLSVKAVEAHGARTPLPIYAPSSPSAIAYREVADRVLRVPVTS